MEIVDKHGEPLEDGARVMVDGGLVGTLTVDETNGWVTIDLDGHPRPPSRLRTETITLQVPGVESLGDGINQAMRAARGQPH